MFDLVADFKPTGDQPQAIQALYKGIKQGLENQTLLGVTGSGKTFTMANVIYKLQRPTLVLAHNKTLAAQLYQEFKAFFPKNAVEYFVSYYDYYQPEAFLPVTGTYIEKDLSINDDLERLRLSTTSSLLSGRRDVLVVSSVSCLYGLGNPTSFNENVIDLRLGEAIGRNFILKKLVQSLYSRSENDFSRGQFRVRGDIIDIYPAYCDTALKLHFWDEEIERIEHWNPHNGQSIEHLDAVRIYPANLFVTSPDQLQHAISNIQDDLFDRISQLETQGKKPEAKRLKERTEYDLEMIKELGYCSGIENYSRYLDGRQAGTRPFCLLDYFPDDYLMIIDESHATIPQIHAMYGGDRSRKQTLVEYGFRLPSALDNRPLKFEEFTKLQAQTIYVSATPADYELNQSEGVIVEQLIRPTGLLDPMISVRPSAHQIDDLINEIQQRISKNQRTLVTTLTKRMAEELTKYLVRADIRTSYIHSDIDTLERVKIMQALRQGVYDVLVGVNLLREGLDLPEVSLVAILDADKEGFLRSHRSLTQTIGRAARHVDGMAIMYADKTTESMQKTIMETERRRKIQEAYNKSHGIKPQPLNKKLSTELGMENTASYSDSLQNPSTIKMKVSEPKVTHQTKDAIQKEIKQKRKEMNKSAKELDFIEAARLRDLIKELEQALKGMN